MCAHGLVCTEGARGGGVEGPTMIRCGFMPALFSGIGTGPKGSSPERGSSTQTVQERGMGRDIMWFGIYETNIGDQ